MTNKFDSASVPEPLLTELFLASELVSLNEKDIPTGVFDGDNLVILYKAHWERLKTAIRMLERS